MAQKIRDIAPKVLLCSIENINDPSIQKQIHHLEVSYVAIDEAQVLNKQLSTFQLTLTNILSLSDPKHFVSSKTSRRNDIFGRIFTHVLRRIKEQYLPGCRSWKWMVLDTSLRLRCMEISESFVPVPVFTSIRHYGRKVFYQNFK